MDIKHANTYYRWKHREGYETAKMLKEAGAQVVICGRNETAIARQQMNRCFWL